MWRSVWSLAAFLVGVFSFIVVELSGKVTSSVVTSCSFENATSPTCGWRRGPGADGDWKRSRGSVKAGTGPSHANLTVGGTYYIYLDSSDFKTAEGIVQPGETVSVATPELAGVTCVIFLYMKYGDDTIGPLHVGLVTNGTKEAPKWKKESSTSDQWICQWIRLWVPTTSSQAIYIEAETGQNELGDIAVDEVFLLDEDCPHSEIDCFQVLKGPSETTTESITSSSSPQSSTSPMSSSSSSSEAPVTGDVASTTKASPAADPEFDLVIIIATVIPVIALLITGIVACLMYRRRLAQSRAKRRPSQDVGRIPQPDPEEEYDVIDPPDTIPDHYDAVADSSGEPSVDYDEIHDSPEGVHT